MKLVKVIFSVVVVSLLCSFVTSTETTTSSKTKMKMQNLQKLLNDYQSFNNRAETYQSGIT